MNIIIICIIFVIIDTFLLFNLASLCNVDKYIIDGIVNIIFTPNKPPAIDANTLISVILVVINPIINTNKPAIFLISAIIGNFILAVSTNRLRTAINIKGVLVKIEAPKDNLAINPSGSFDTKLFNKYDLTFSPNAEIPLYIYNI